MTCQPEKPIRQYHSLSDISSVCYWRILTEFASMLVGPVCLCVCVSVCLWTSLRRYNTVSLQHINMTSTWQHSLTLNYRLTFFQRSRSKVKVTGVKSLIFGWNAINQKVFVRFSQKLQDMSSKVWDRSLFQDDLERSKVKVTAGVKVRKFTKNDLITHFLS